MFLVYLYSALLSLLFHQIGEYIKLKLFIGLVSVSYVLTSKLKDFLINWKAHCFLIIGGGNVGLLYAIINEQRISL